jgi:carbamoyltransferase
LREWILGLGGSDHDGSAALMRGNDIVVAIEEERLTRRKHGMSNFFHNPVEKSVAYCLDYASLSLADVEIVSSNLLPARVRFEYRRLPTKLYPHHLCHAAAAYMLLPPDSCAGVLVYDGAGSIQKQTGDDPIRNVRETFTFFVIRHATIECLGQTCGTGVWEYDDFPSAVNDSVGFFYEFISGMLGFDVLDGGKTMGLAAYGVPRYLSDLELFIVYGTTPDDCFRCELDHPGLRALIERILLEARGSFSAKADIAASAQQVVNKALLNASRVFQALPIDYLCVSGGCALNTVANSYLIEHVEFDVPVVIPPHSGDSGLALGALWLAAQERGYTTVTFRGGATHPAICRPGRQYDEESCLLAARDYYPELAHDASVASAEELAAEIAAGRIVGLFSGGAEIGPRALGGRSILADPRNALIRERLNRQIKHREPFRPLAPMILEERYDAYFEDPRQKDAYMLKVPRATAKCRREAPAVVHVDGTARVQVVGPDGDPFLRALLVAFEKHTGLPLLLNTSFNRRGEPIVETPSDAVDSFIGLGLDGLYLQGHYYRRVSSSF